VNHIAPGIAEDIEAVARIGVVPTMLEIICQVTGMGFAAVARVTEDRWVACSVLDNGGFGLQPGGELAVETTYCHEIRLSGKAIIFDHASKDVVYRDHPTTRMYAVGSYIAVPIRLTDGSIFGTLCANDRAPREVNTPTTIAMFEMFADLIGLHLSADQELKSVLVLNQELQSLNAELSGKNALLAGLNNDIRNLLDSTDIATLLLDRDSCVKNFTANLAALFENGGIEIGSAIGELKLNFDYPTLTDDVALVMTTGEVVEREVTSRGESPHVFVTHLRPYRRADKSADGVVLTFVDITERKRSENQVWYYAHHDILTGLPNRTMFQSLFENALPGNDGMQSGVTGAPATLLMLDLDRFKAVNDTFGHAVGDQVLQHVAMRLRRCVKVPDMVCRLGGDEFAIVQTRALRRDRLKAMVDGILLEVSKPYEIAGYSINISASIGIAFRADTGGGCEAMMLAADAALYEAKRIAGNNASIFDLELQRRRQDRRSLEAELRVAVVRDELELMYQPLVRLSDGRITGAEALVRWRNSRLGLLAPADFISIAEDTGLIVPIGNWVLRNACKAAAAWVSPVSVAVNLSSVQFVSGDIVAEIREALKATKLAPGRLTVEVTETIMLQDNFKTQEIFAALHEAGIAVSMDDFGTGFSSLSYLQKFRINKIKVDRSFTRLLDEQPKTCVIIKAIVAMGEGLGIEVCAEGAETKEQLAMLAELGVKEVQGYALYPPLSASEFAGLLV
jgi:diguanylate cyclase (GGDEF)-like protein